MMVVRPLRIFWAGRLARDKNVQTLLRALALCPSWYSLRVAGSGPALKPLRKLVERLGISERVTFLEQISKKQMSEEYDACDVYCQPSLVLDALPRVCLEAMPHGKHCIVSDRCGTVGVETVVPAMDYKQWARALMFLNEEQFEENPLMVERVKNSLRKPFSTSLKELLFGTDGAGWV